MQQHPTLLFSDSLVSVLSTFHISRRSLFSLPFLSLHFPLSLLHFLPSQLYMHLLYPTTTQATIKLMEQLSNKMSLAAGKKEPRVKDLHIRIVISTGSTVTVGKEAVPLVHGSHDNPGIIEATATFELDENWAADEVTLIFRAICNSRTVGIGKIRKYFKGTVLHYYKFDIANPLQYAHVVGMAFST